MNKWNVPASIKINPEVFKLNGLLILAITCPDHFGNVPSNISLHNFTHALDFDSLETLSNILNVSGVYQNGQNSQKSGNLYCLQEHDEYTQ